MSRTADPLREPKFSQNPDVPWRDETMYYVESHVEPVVCPRCGVRLTSDVRLASPTQPAPRFRATDEARWATPGLPAMAVAIWKAAILLRRQPNDAPA